MTKGGERFIGDAIVSPIPIRMMKPYGLEWSSSSVPNQKNKGVINIKTIILQDKVEGDNHNG